jgi:hypothetical protein
MENRRILNWHSWSPTHKGLTLGGICGIVVTIATYALSSLRFSKLLPFFFACLFRATLDQAAARATGAGRRRGRLGALTNKSPAFPKEVSR